MPSENSLIFSINARTAILLGRENIPTLSNAVLELVKNAYDADARNVLVRFRNAGTREGTILIRDDGHGMTKNDIENKWMLIGTINKLSDPVSPGGRIKAGEKGIGRFALDRLAEVAILETKSRGNPGYRVEIDWSRFEKPDVALHDISFPLIVLNSEEVAVGTTLRLSNLRDTWKKAEYEKLYRDLSTLIPPYGHKVSQFKLKFEADDHPELARNIDNKIVNAALFKINATLTAGGISTIRITTREGTKGTRFLPFKNYTRTWKDLFGTSEEVKPECGPIQFEFYFFLREAGQYKDSNITLGQIRDFLDIYGGIHIYRDGIRIRPYGDPMGGDWLDLNKRRVRHPAGVSSRTAGKWVVGENQVAGAVFISRETNLELLDQSNRSGLIANQAFRDMQAFILKMVEIFEDDRKAFELKKVARKKLDVSREISDAELGTRQSIEDIKEVVLKLPTSENRATLIKDLDQLERQHNENINRIKKDYEEEKEATLERERILENQATVGIVISEIGHEVIETSLNLKEVSRKIITGIRKLPQDTIRPISEYLKMLEKFANKIFLVSSFALLHVRSDKRRRRSLNISEEINNLHKETLKDIASDNHSIIELILRKVPNTKMYPYQIESLLMNFVTNSFAAFRRDNIPLGERIIQFETRFAEKENRIFITARDNARGIPEGDEDRIFGYYSTKRDESGNPSGTGIGLSIVKRIVQSNNGDIRVVRNGEKLPGAEFIVSIPVTK